MKQTTKMVNEVTLRLAIGDALGRAVETKTGEQIKSIREDLGLRDWEYIPGGYRAFENSPPGATTDDTQLTLATMQALTEAGWFDMNTIAKWQVAAMRESTAGWGGSTIASTQKLASGMSWTESGKTDESGRGEGNGVIMKIAPIVLSFVEGMTCNSADRIIATDSLMRESVGHFTIMTHNTENAIVASHAMAMSMIYAATFEIHDPVSMLTYVIESTSITQQGGVIKTSPIRNVLTEMRDHLSRDREYFRKNLYDGKYGDGSCHVVQSLPVVLGIFALYTDSFQGIVEAANFGGDTDTNAAMVGALQGFRPNPEPIPRELIDRLEGKEQIKAVVSSYCNKFNIT